MKKIYETLRTTRTALMVLLVGLLMLVANVARTQEVTIFTDKDDYWPGEWVIITGEGWQGDDSVKITLEHIEPNIPAHTHAPWYLKPDANGRIYDEWFVFEEELGTTFHLMALGIPTGRYAENWFTDGSGLTIPVVSQSVPVYSGAGGTITYSTTAARDNANNSFTATLSATGLPTGVTASFSPSSLNYVGGTPPQSFTLTLTIASTVSAQTYPFSINDNSGFNLVVGGCTNPQVSSFVSATGNTSICAGDQGQLTMTTSSGTGPFTVIYNNGTSDVTVEEVVSGTPFSVIPSPTSGTTTYILKSVTDANGCSRTSGFTDGTASISVRQLPTATITGTATVCQNATSPNIIFTGTAPGGTIPPYTFTYKINDGTEQTITTTSGSSVTLSAPTNTAGVFNYSLVSVAFASSPNCTNTASGNAVVTVQPVPTLSINDVTVNEADGTAIFTVTLSAAVVCDVTFDVATADNTANAGSDYTAITTTQYTIAANTTSTTISVTIADDAVLEGNETYFVNLSNANNASILKGQGIGTINNDDAAAVTIADVSGDEDDGAITVTLALDYAVQGGFTVKVNTNDGTATTADGDYTDVVDQVITFAGTEGETQTFTVTPTADTKLEANETVTVAMSALSTLLPVDITDGATVTFNNDDAAAVTIADVSGDEDDGAITVTPTADTKLEANETVTVAMSALSTLLPVDITDGATVTFNNDDAATLSLVANDAVAGEPNNNGQFTVTQSNPADVATVIAYTVSGTATSGSDYTALSGTVTIPANATTATINVIVIDNLVTEPGETVIVTLASITFGHPQVSIDAIQKVATVNIADNDASSLAINDVIVNESAGTAVFTVTLTGAIQDALTVDYASSDVTALDGSDYTALTPGTLTFTGGSASGAQQTITVTILDGVIAEPTETYNVTLSHVVSTGSASISKAIGVGTITDNDAYSISLAGFTVEETEATQTKNFVATMSGEAQEDVVLTFNTTVGTAGAADFTAQAATSVTIFAGQTTVDIPVSILGDAIVEPQEAFTGTIVMSNANGQQITVLPAGKTATATINDNDFATIAINSPAAVIEGNSITFTVTLTGDVQGGFKVAYNTTDGTAKVADNDYNSASGLLTFAGTNNEAKTFIVATINDVAYEPLETFNAVLGAFSNFGGGNLTIATGTGIGTIIDNDVNLTLDKPTATTGQYSDVIELQATLLNGSGVGLEGQTITFKVGTQPVTATTDANGVAATTLKLDQNPNTLTNDKVVATFTANTVGGIPYETKVVEKAFDIVQEDAIVDYTGPEFVGESNPNLSSTPVLLSASIMDYPDGTGNEGDIRNTRVMFYDVNTMADISGWLTPGLVTPGDYTKGIVTFNWNVPVPTSGYNTFTIGVKIDETGYYVGGPTQSVLNVYRTTLNEFITGGGHIIPMDSKGEYASDPGKKVNFGYNVKWNKSLKNLQGNLNLIFRRGDQVYQIKTNATENLSVNTMNPCSQQATFTSKANLTNVTNSAMPVSVYGGLSLSVTMTDNGEPGVADMIGFTLYNGSTLIYSSSWPVNKTVELPLVGGNNVVHNGTICNASTATTTAITSTKNPSVLGDMVTFKATVTESLTADPEGTITFKIDGENPGIIVPVVGSSASWSTDALTQGSHTITAVYASSNGFDSSTGSLNQIVSQTSVSVVSNANPSSAGSNVSFTATVIAGDDTKTVTFKDGATVLGTQSISGGVAILTTNTLTVGSHNITAVYNGSTSVTSPILVQVVNNGVTVSVSSSKNPSNTGEQIGLTATVTDATTGTVTFKDGAATIGSANISGGAATLNYTFSTAGTHSITAVYGTTTSAAYAQVVNSTTAVTLSSSVNPSNQSQSVKFTATVNGGTGSVKFYDNGSLKATVSLTGGVASYTTSALSLGSHVIKAQYFNTSNVLVSEASLTQVVTNLSIALTSSRNPAPTRTNITFTATVTGTGGFIPSGTVTFKNGTTTLGTATMSNGKATLTKSFTSAAVLSITVVYNVTGLTSGVLLQTITSTKSAEIATGIVPDIEYADLKVYPNPFSDRLRFEFVNPESVNARIDLYDMTGRLVKNIFEQPIEGGVSYNAEFRPEAIISGMYIYRVTMGEAIYNGKVTFKKE